MGENVMEYRPTGKRILSILFFILAAGLIFLLSSCTFNAGEEPGKATVKVLFADDPGVDFSVSGITEVSKGEALLAEFTLKDGYTLERLEGAALTDDGKLTTGPVYYPTTVIFKTRLLRDCEIICKTSDFGDNTGADYGQVSPSSVNVREGDPLTLTAAAGNQFGFVGYSLEAPLNAGGELISSSAVFDYVPSSSATIYANFKREYATVRLEETPGIIIRTVDEITAKVGTTVFFAFDYAEGYVFSELGDGLTFDGSLVTATISKPATYKIYTTALPKRSVSVKANVSAGGNITVSPDKNYAYDGDTVTVSVKPNTGYVFLGYSDGKALSAGGRLVADRTEYSLIVDKDINLIANFEKRTYDVTLKCSEGVTASASKLSVAHGDTAKFTVTIADGYEFTSVSDGAVFDAKTGTVTMANVTGNAGLIIDVHKKNDIYYSYSVNESEWGSVSSSLQPGYYSEGTTVKVTAVPKKGSIKNITVGGKVVATSFSYSFKLKRNADNTVVVNFNPPPDPALTVSVPNGKWVILYHPNGGTCTLTKDDYLTETYNATTIYHCPNAKPDLGVFKREGYVLLGYNTERDGSGTFYAPGWNVIMPERGAISLWCVWIKASPAEDFTYTVSASTKTFQYSKSEKITTKYVTITKYKGTDTTVVIPETIDGYPVTHLSAGVFKDNKNLTTLVFPRCIISVASSTVQNCQNFTTLRFFDSVQTMPDDWYAKCPNFSKIYLGAMRMPSYLSGRNGTYAVKFDWLITAPGKKIVIVSGSNSAYGIDSPLLESKLKEAGYEYSVVNYGQNASTAAAFYIEVISNYINPGDILIHEPELNKFQYGHNEIDNVLWQIFEGAYDAYSCVDIRHYFKLFSVMAARNTNARSRDPQSYETFTTDTVNAWGDYSKKKVGTDEKTTQALDGYDKNGGFGSNSFSTPTGFINNNTSTSYNGTTFVYVQEINRAYDLIAAKGGKVLFSSCVAARIAFTKASQINDGAEQTAFMKAVDTKLHVTRISVPSDYLFERQYLYNSIYHVNTEGQVIRTGLLARDLIAYFSK